MLGNLDMKASADPNSSPQISPISPSVVLPPSYPYSGGYLPNQPIPGMMMPSFSPPMIDPKLFDTKSQTPPKKTPDKTITREYAVKVSHTVVFDILSVLMMIGFLICFDVLLGLTNTQTNAKIVQISITIVLSALMGCVCFVVFRDMVNIRMKLDNSKFLSEWGRGFLYLLPIVAINLIRSQFLAGSRVQYSTQAIASTFVIVNAFGEEMVFALFLTSFFTALSKNNLQKHFMIWLVGGIFVVYHIFVYQTIEELLVVLIIRVALNYAYTRNYRLSVPLTLHLLNNLLSILV